MRNEILYAARTRSSPWGRARAIQLKQRERTLEALAEKYSQRLFNQGMDKLTPVQQSAVSEELIRAAGRPDPKYNAAARNLGRFARGLWVVTSIIAIWDITYSKDRIATVIRDLSGAIAGFAGSIIGGAIVGATFGPIGAIIGGLIGGILFSLFTDQLSDSQHTHYLNLCIVY